jgi:amino acid transporter
VFQIAPLIAVLVGAPDLARLMASASPLSAFILAVGGPVLAKVMSAGVALALFNAMIASALMGGRQLYSSGRDRAWPGRLSAAFARLHPRFNSPWIATLAVGAAALLWCLVRLDVLVVLIGEGTAAIYVCMCLAALRGRRSGASAHGPYRMPAFPLTPVLALMALAAVGGADLFDPDGRKGLLASAVVIAASVLYYRLVLHHRGGWAHRGPGGAFDRA